MSVDDRLREASYLVAKGFAEVGMPAFIIAVGWDAEAHKTTKRPLVTGGFKAATVVLERLEAMWANPFPLHEGEVYAAGLHPGGGNTLVLDVDINDRVRGDETLAALEKANGKLPETCRVITASGGVHLWFRKPRGQSFSNHTPWEGIDVRADAGFVVAPGTVTPYGSWLWEEGYNPLEGATLYLPPVWVIDHLGRYREGQGVPWRSYNEGEHTPEDVRLVNILVEQYGAHSPVTVTKDGRPIVSLVRPGKVAGKSAEVGWLRPGVVQVFTTDWMGLPAGTWDLDEVASGTFTTRSDRVREWITEANAGVVTPGTTGPRDVLASWRLPTEGYAEWLLGATPEPPPEVLVRADGRALFYRGRTNMIVARRAEGKTMTAEFMVGQAAGMGLRSLYLDMESNRAEWLERLKIMDYPVEDYVRQGLLSWWKPGSLPLGNMPELVDYLASRWDIVVCDVVNRFVSRMGGDVDTGNRQVLWLFDNLYDPLANRGVCVVLLDHPNKRGQRQDASVDDMTPGGGALKLNTLSGMGVTLTATQRFSRGHGGRLHLVCLKDRAGHWTEGEHVATLVGQVEMVTGDTLGMRMSLTEPTAEAVASTDLDVVVSMKILRALDEQREREGPEGDGLTMAELRAEVAQGEGARQIRDALTRVLRGLVKERVVRSRTIPNPVGGRPATFYSAVLPGDSVTVPEAVTGTSEEALEEPEEPEDGPEGWNPI